MTDTPHKKTRSGRLNSLDLLPIEAEDDVIWAYKEIHKRKMTQADILDQLNLRLTLKNIKTISSSAFNRAAIRTARMAHRLGEVKEIATALATKFEDGADETLTLLVSETIKSMVFEMLENSGKIRTDGASAEMMMNLSRALKHSEEAKKISADTRKMVEKDFAVKTEETLHLVAKKQGLSNERVVELRREFLGLDKVKSL
jgi:uncharacterized membrane protein YheB (UPF0754 family)